MSRTLCYIPMCFLALSEALGQEEVLGTTRALEAEPQQKAILVGINEYPDEEHRLFGCHNDVALMRSVLEEVYGFPGENIVVLKDREATTARLTETIKEHFIRGTRPQDRVVFFFAGHGTGVQDFDGDEADGIDETLQTYDFDPQNPETWFTDDLIFELFSRIPARQVLAIHDCCHSGTGNRGAWAAGYPDAGGDEVLYRFSDSGYRTFELDRVPDRDAFQRSRTVVSAGGNPNHVYLGACQDHQFAQETRIGGVRHGLFTHVVARTMRENPRLAFGALAERVRDEVREKVAANPGLAAQDPASDLGDQADTVVREYLASGLVLPPAPPAPESGEGIPVHRPLTLEEVVPGYRPSGNITLALSTNERVFAQNDLMEIELISDTDAWVEIYYYGVDDSVYRIFPNRFAPDNHVKAGERIRIPGEAGFQLRVYLPDDFEGARGNEVLKAVASSEPFSEEERARNEAEIFRQVDGTRLNPAENRLIEVMERRREFGEAMLIYSIER